MENPHRLTGLKVIFAVGGTGGHFYPALGLARRLQAQAPELSLLFAGGGIKHKGSNPIDVPYTTIFSGTVSLRRPIKSVAGAWRLWQGYRQSCLLIKKERPALVIGFGSYYALPLLFAAQTSGVPYVLHEQNAIPGKVVRLFSKKALFTAVHLPCSACYLGGKTVEGGMPLREGFRLGTMNRYEAICRYGLDPAKPVVLIFGGSQGASAINRSLVEGLKACGRAPFQLLHFTGNPAETEQLSAVYKRMNVGYAVKDFEEKMDIAWQAADLVVSRSGAGTLAEMVEFEVPGILIPYPHSADNHQEANADFIVDTVQGGEKMLERQMNGRVLVEGIMRLLESRRLSTMKSNMRAYKSRRKEHDFGDLILDALERLSAK